MKRFLIPLILFNLAGGCHRDGELPSLEVTGKTAAAVEVVLVKSPTNAAALDVRNASSGLLIDGPLEDVDWSSLDGREVTLHNMVVVDSFSLLRRGQLTLARDRLQVPTSVVDPNDANPSGTTFEGGSNVAPVIAMETRNKKAIILIDDTSDRQNIFPPPLLPTLGSKMPTVRLGSRVPTLSGTVSLNRGKPVIKINEALRLDPAPRPSRPDLGNPDWTIASFNVLNYFTTIDDGKNGARGADTSEELTRQRDKIVAAILALDADVVGLMELQNDAKSELNLVQSLNMALKADLYAGCGIPSDLDIYPGGANAIRVGMIYRKDKVEPIGDPRWIRDYAFSRARTPLSQTFRPVVGGNSSSRKKAGVRFKPVTVIVNHFKSKGSASKAGKADKNKGDGQAAYNATRRSQSLAVAKFISNEFTADDRVLVIGDLNSYSQEDPIDALRSKGLVDLGEAFANDASNTTASLPPYSYVYYGQSGSLDHAFATPALAKSVTSTAVWHINADEPVGLDYNLEFKPRALYKPDPWRSSDHDPVLIGIKN